MLRLKATAETHEMKRDCIIRLPQSALALAHACTMRTVCPRWREQKSTVLVERPLSMATQIVHIKMKLKAKLNKVK